MRHLATALFVVVGLINFFPVIGVLGAARLESLYGVPIGGDDLLLLMRHRAILFGLIGAFIVIAAFRVHWRGVATAAGLSSMLAFILLALPLASHGAALQRVFWVDVVACVLLFAGYWLSRQMRETTR